MDELLLSGATENLGGPEFLLATVASTSNSGITLIFDGQTAASQKAYKNISNMDPYKVGDRVVVMKLSGTYVVLGSLKTSAFPVWKTTSLSDIITAASGFSITDATYYRYGRISQLYVKASATTASSSASWNTVGTLADGKHPVDDIFMVELNSKANCLYKSGNLKVYGTYSSGASFEFSATYIHN